MKLKTVKKKKQQKTGQKKLEVAKKKIWHKQTTKLQQIEDCETHIVTARENRCRSGLKWKTAGVGPEIKNCKLYCKNAIKNTVEYAEKKTKETEKGANEHEKVEMLELTSGRKLIQGTKHLNSRK